MYNLKRNTGYLCATLKAEYFKWSPTSSFGKLSLVALLGLAGSACVSTRTSQLSDTTGNTWHGKSVAVTARPTPDFVAMTAGKAAFALVGAVAMIEAGKTIVAENGIQDSQPYMSQEILKAAIEQFGVTAATMPPIVTDTTDVPKLAQAAAGSDLLFDVQSMGSSFRYLPLDWSHYYVDFNVKLRIIDVHSKSIVAEGFCHRPGDDDKHPPTKDELLANKAALLKEKLKAHWDSCVAEFDTKVLNVRLTPPGASTAAVNKSP